MSGPERIETGDGRLGVWRDAPALEGLRTAALGAFECADGAGGARLLREAITQLKAEGVEAVLGPMDGDTWGRYRLVVESDGSAPFLLEPSHPPHQVAAFEGSGLEIVSRYASAVREAAPPERTGRTLPGVHVRLFDPARAEADLARIHAVSLTAFAAAPFYRPIALQPFLDSYRPVLGLIDPELVLLAESEAGELVGFVFAIPNYAEGPTPASVILKTYASLRPGVGSLLADLIHERAHRRGVRSIIHALMHEANLSLRHSDRTGGRVFRRYALWGGRL